MFRAFAVVNLNSNPVGEMKLFIIVTADVLFI